MNDADLVPEPYQMRLMMWRDEFTRGYFEIGDIANEIILLNIKSGSKVEQSSIYAAIGRFCGKSGRTVRDYAEISAFFPIDTRDKYDMLPFSHFRFAKSMGRKWQDVLDYSMLHPEVSEGKLAFEFDYDAYQRGMDKYVAAPTKTGIGTVASVTKDDILYVAPTVAASVAADLSGIFILSNLVSQAEEMLASWKMAKDTRRKLLVALEGLKDVLQDLSEKESSLKFDYQAKEFERD